MPWIFFQKQKKNAFYNTVDIDFWRSYDFIVSIC